jgi:hypothetical protein
VNWIELAVPKGFRQVLHVTSKRNVDLIAEYRHGVTFQRSCRAAEEPDVAGVLAPPGFRVILLALFPLFDTLQYFGVASFDVEAEVPRIVHGVMRRRIVAVRLRDRVVPMLR